MLDLSRELRDVAAALDAADVTYALAGGLAVSVYTAPRATQDIDLLLAADLLLPLDTELASILADRAEMIWEGTRLSIVTLSGLRTLKRLRGSPQDRADLDALGPDSP